MKAIVWTGYGSPDHLELRDVAQPVPTDGELLIRIHAASLSTPDTELRRLNLPLWFAIPIRPYLGILKPTRITILGGEFAGEVVQTGKGVTRFQPGDAVYGYTGLRMGTHAEYICLPEQGSGLGGVLAPKPANLAYEEAAAVPFGALEALHTLLKAAIQSGQRVLIVGAGGSIGTYAVQLARQAGAEVTGVDSAGKLDMLRSLGAAHVIDYAQEDFTRNGQTYDVILDTINKSPFFRSLRSLNENGVYLNPSPGLSGRLWLRWSAQNSRKKVIPWSAGYTTANLQAVTTLVEAGTLQPVIDRRYTLAQVPEAHRYVDSGQKKGNVVIRVMPDLGA
jgi:NADPH:quinone reductase-like Zn-dependent oxidoreductase